MKLIYSHYEVRHFSEPDRRIYKAFGVLPRLSYSIHLARFRLGFSGGLFGYVIQDWNDKALRESRPLPVDGFQLGLPALGIQVGYEI